MSDGALFQHSPGAGSGEVTQWVLVNFRIQGLTDGAVLRDGKIQVLAMSDVEGVVVLC